MNNSTSKKKKPAKKPRIYLQVREVVDVETGRKCLALLAEDGVQRSAMKERGFKKGQRVAADIHPERCYQQWKKAHVLGMFMVQNIVDFEGLDAHGAIKKLQFDSDIECEHEAFDLGSLGQFSRKVAKSLSFDGMGQDVFNRVYSQLCDALSSKYFPGMGEAEIEEMIKLMPTDHA